MLKYFYAPGTCALAGHIALREAGADHEIQRVDFKSNEQNSPAFLGVNPKGRVPALVTDRGVLTESPAILAYVAQSFPEAKLAPADDAFAFAEIQAFNLYLCSTLHVAHAHRPRASRWADDPAAMEAMKAKVPENMTSCLRMIEDNMFAGPWVMGESYTICDPYLFTLGRWMEADGVDPAGFPRIIAHREAMMARPAVAEALALEEA